MPSAKETLDKIAQAIGIATATPEVETVEETVETVETPEVDCSGPNKTIAPDAASCPAINTPGVITWDN